MLERVTLLVGLVLAALAASVAVAAVSPAATEHRCHAGLRHAVIAGRHRCLRAGQRCTLRHDRQYHRYGFHCHGARLSATPSNLSFPVRAAFYYPWFPETWTVRGRHVAYRPMLGYYSSSDAAVARSHVRQLEHARVEAAIASWWGPGTHFESFRLPLLLRTSAAIGSLKWAVYHEQEGSTDPPVAALQRDLAYLRLHYARHRAYARVNGRPVIFVYNANDSTCEVANRWKQAADGWYVVLKVFPGYTACASQPDSWHQYGPAQSATAHLPHSYTISPGFWRADEPAPRLRRDPARWRQNVEAMVASGARWQLVTTFNEWGEGTAVESAHDWSSPSGRGAYLDVLRATRPP